jgi:hypothetical protein
MRSFERISRQLPEADMEKITAVGPTGQITVNLVDIWLAVAEQEAASGNSWISN